MCLSCCDVFSSTLHSSVICERITCQCVYMSYHVFVVLACDMNIHLVMGVITLRVCVCV